MDATIGGYLEGRAIQLSKLVEESLHNKSAVFLELSSDRQFLTLCKSVLQSSENAEARKGIGDPTAQFCQKQDICVGDGIVIASLDLFKQAIEGVDDHVFCDELVCDAVSGDDLIEGALQVADIGIHLFGNQINYIIADFHIGDMVVLLFQDGGAREKVGRLDIHNDTCAEAGLEPFFKMCDILGRTVARDHDLLFCLKEGIEKVEKFLLRSFLSREKLHIIQKEQVYGLVTGAELENRVVLDGIYKL